MEVKTGVTEMRILGFSQKWPKLQQDEFTTFRYPRKDSDRGRDWHFMEIVKIIYHPRHEHEYLGIAQIIAKNCMQIQMITDEEAIADGFEDSAAMMEFLNSPVGYTAINKLTIRYIQKAIKSSIGIDSKR